MAKSTRDPKLQPASSEAAGMRFAIVAARFNWHITEPLLKGAQAAFKKAGVTTAIPVIQVPGAFEIPLVAKRLVETKLYDAVLTLGAVIRGDTPHFDYVAGECARGVMQVGLVTGVPVLFGVLTTDNEAQAVARAGGPKGETLVDNKGADCALSAIETVLALRLAAKK